MREYDYIELKPITFMKENKNTVISKMGKVVSYKDDQDYILKIAYYLNGRYTLSSIYEAMIEAGVSLIKGEVIDIIDRIFFDNDFVLEKKGDILEAESLIKYDRALNFFSSYENKNHQDSQENQLKIEKAHVLILGVGGVGSHVAHALAASGVGRLTIVDCDNVELSNVTRQVLFDMEDVGFSKVEAAKRKLKKVNKKIDVKTFNLMIESEEVLENILEKIDNIYVIVSAIDTPRGKIRIIVDNVLYKYKKPYIFLGSIGATAICGPFLLNGKTKSLKQLLSNGSIDISNTYNDLVLEINERIFKSSVIEPFNGVAGQMTAYEIIKFISGHSEVVTWEKDYRINLDNMEFRENGYRK